MTGIEYRLSPEVGGDDLHALLAEAWPDRNRRVDFEPVFRRSLGWVCAYRSGELVGFVNVAWDGGAHAFLLDTTVRSDCRRQGIGRRLVRLAEGLARDRCVEWLHVDFTPELELFYRKCGFRASKAGLIDLKATRG